MLVLSSMTSNKCFLPPKVEIEGELISKNSLPFKLLGVQQPSYLHRPFLFYPGCNLHTLNVQVTWIHIDLVVTQVMTPEGGSNLTCRSFTFILLRVMADLAFCGQFLEEIWLQLPSHHKTWCCNLGWYCLLTSGPWCCSCGHFLWYSLVRVCILWKSGLHLPWGNTSWAIECVPIQYHQLGKQLPEAFTFYWAYCPSFPVPICWFQ